MGQGDYGVDPLVLRRIADEINDIWQWRAGPVVIGGGNIFSRRGVWRVLAWIASPAITWAMLATVMNALANAGCARRASGCTCA